MKHLILRLFLILGLATSASAEKLQDSDIENLTEQFVKRGELIKSKKELWEMYKGSWEVLSQCWLAFSFLLEDEGEEIENSRSDDLYNVWDRYILNDSSEFLLYTFRNAIFLELGVEKHNEMRQFIGDYSKTDPMSQAVLKSLDDKNYTEIYKRTPWCYVAMCNIINRCDEDFMANRYDLYKELADSID